MICCYRSVCFWGGLDLAIFRVLGVCQNIHLNKLNLALGVLRNKSSDTKYIHACRQWSAIFFWNRSRDCSVYTTSEDGVLRRTLAQMFQRTWFLFCLFRVEGVKRTAKSISPLMSCDIIIAIRQLYSASEIVTGLLWRRSGKPRMTTQH